RHTPAHPAPAPARGREPAGGRRPRAASRGSPTVAGLSEARRERLAETSEGAVADVAPVVHAVEADLPGCRIGGGHRGRNVRAERRARGDTGGRPHETA